MNKKITEDPFLRKPNAQRKYFDDYIFVPDVGVVKTTPMDRALGRSIIIDDHVVLADQNPSLKIFGVLPIFRDLLGDAFFSYYLNDPEFVDRDDLLPEYRISQMLLAWMSEQPDSQSAKLLTTSSAPASVAAAMFAWRAMMSDEAFEAIRNAIRDLEEMRREINEQRAQEKAEDDYDERHSRSNESPEEEPEPEEQDGGGQSEQQSGGQQEQEQQGSGSQPQRKSEQMQEEYENKAKSVEKSIENMMDNPIANGAMRQTARDSRDKMEKLAAVAKAWGLEIGDMGVVDMTAILALYEQNSRFIDRLSDLIGRSEVTSVSALERVRETYVGTPSKISLTQDLSKVLPFESLLLSEMSPHIIRTQQVIDWANQGLLGWIDESEGKTQGSFVAYVDGSGSMEGDRILTAKAIAFGLAKTLHDDSLEQRTYVIKTFGSEDDGFIEIDETSNMEEIARWSSMFFNGGTEFDYCFSDCLKVMETLEKREILGTDLIFMTDGESQLSKKNIKKWDEFSKRTGSRMIFVHITDKDGSSYGRQAIRDMKRMCDLYIKIKPKDFIKNSDAVINQIMDVFAVQRKDEYMS